jgi:LPXTG-motif cell wall-anchored protein
MVLLALLALGLTVAGTSAQANKIVVTLHEQNNSGQQGTATLVDAGNGKTTVTINISGGSSVPQPAHIHEGTCENLNPKPAYPLTSVVNGTSQTTVDVSLSELTREQYAINVHKSAAEVTTYVACGNISAMVVGMPTTGSNMQLTLLATGLIAVVLAGTGLMLARRRA